MPTSELSDALNPYVAQPRLRQLDPLYSPSQQPLSQYSHQYVPHRSELELAISEPASQPSQRNKASPEGIHAVQELIRVVNVTREAQEIERKRRLAWEKEQDAKASLMQAEFQRQMLEMRQEIAALRNFTSMNPSNGIPQVAVSTRQPASPISPISQPSSHTFVQGSSNNPLQAYNDAQAEMSSIPHQSMTPSDSDLLVPSTCDSPAPRSRKRRHSTLSADSSSDSDDPVPRRGRPSKRTNHHDRRCLTIHHALRIHIMRLMEVEDDKCLPDSHVESAPFDQNDPVRFVWDKTVMQSVHNKRMKARVLDDIRLRRSSYKAVPERDFGKKPLETAFEQVYTTFRQKYKAQKDAVAAESMKRREDIKATKARHLSRRKIKLSNRSDARMKIGTFDHVIFDGALQVECMSSEESDFEDDNPIFRTRSYAWRSSRLLRFYGALDEEEKADKIDKPKRGVGKKERRTGPLKDGFHLPPNGVASWMISKRWLAATQAVHPDLPDVLNKLLDNPPGFDWNEFHDLGDGSDEDQDLDSPSPSPPPPLVQQIQPHYTTSSSSLHNALA